MWKCSSPRIEFGNCSHESNRVDSMRKVLTWFVRPGGGCRRGHTRVSLGQRQRCLLAAAPGALGLFRLEDNAERGKPAFQIRGKVAAFSCDLVEP
jgi:hypothetical protein